MNITASLVLFHNDPVAYGRAISSFLKGCDGTLYVVDNSRAPLQHELFGHLRVNYHFAGRNLGFGSANNKIFAQLPPQSDVHLLLNPDVEFGSTVLSTLMQRMQEEGDIGAIMPRIVYPNGELQHVGRLLPTPIAVARRFVPLKMLRDRVNRRHELHGLRQDRPSDIPCLSGCFMLIRTALLRRLGGFDERYFMYMEDIDLIRRIGDVARTVYEPSVMVTHGYARASHRNRRAFVHHARSAALYFNKWGWFYDPVRSERNRRVLEMLKR